MRIGILALQGAFEEHATRLQAVGVDTVFVRKPEELEGCDALVLPGGESTTMASLARRWGLMEPLRAWKKPIWGTCAGLILLSDAIESQKQDGQENIGGLDIVANRNRFGSQKQSFEATLHTIDGPQHGIFIRAPGIALVGPKATVLATLDVGGTQEPVAVVQGSIMATCFHPELDPTSTYWQQLFIGMVNKR